MTDHGSPNIPIHCCTNQYLTTCYTSHSVLLSGHTNSFVLGFYPVSVNFTQRKLIRKYSRNFNFPFLYQENCPFHPQVLQTSLFLKHFVHLISVYLCCIKSLFLQFFPSNLRILSSIHFHIGRLIIHTISALL